MSNPIIRDTDMMMGVESLPTVLPVEDTGFLDSAYCVSRLSTTLDRPPTNLCDVRFVDTKPWFYITRRMVAFKDRSNDEYLKSLEDEEDMDEEVSSIP